MRTRKFAIGAVMAVAGSLVFANVASSAVTNQTYSSVAAKTKQDRKLRGPVGAFRTDVDTSYANGFTPAGRQTVIAFDNAFKFDPGTLADCNPASLTGQTAAGARIACPDSIVGAGSSIVTTLAGTQLNGVVTAFNGVPAGSSPVILLHVDIAGVPTKPILTGTLSGSTLTVDVPTPPGTVITHFDTTIDQIKTKKANKKKGKPATYYVSAKCNDGSWDHTENTTFTDGSNSGLKTFAQACTKKKPKGGKK